MKLASISFGGAVQAAIVAEEGFYPVEKAGKLAGKSWSTDLFGLLQREEWRELGSWYKQEGKERLRLLEPLGFGEADFAPPYRNPRKILGIGMNYIAKAEELSAVPPDHEPIFFLKPDTSLIGAGETIRLPAQSQRVTAEAELGIVIGKSCKNIGEEEAAEVVAGYIPTLDMTAQDIHARNPRFLGRSKCFDTFFSFGPYLITTDEVTDPGRLTVETGLNGRIAERNTVANMIYSPWFIVSYFSKMMTLFPGDVIMTGTPGSVQLREGDVAECKIGDFAVLRNPVLEETATLLVR